MLDINLLRVEKGGAPAVVERSQTKRGKDAKTVHDVIEKYERLCKGQYELDQLSNKRKTVQLEIAKQVKSGAKPDAELLMQKKEAEEQRTVVEKRVQELNKDFVAAFGLVGNVLDSSTPNEDTVVVTFGNQDPKASTITVKKLAEITKEHTVAGRLAVSAFVTCSASGWGYRTLACSPWVLRDPNTLAKCPSMLHAQITQF
eukprot:Colp12_sorted_trinity150504_noHs@19127